VSARGPSNSSPRLRLAQVCQKFVRRCQERERDRTALADRLQLDPSVRLKGFKVVVGLIPSFEAEFEMIAQPTTTGTMSAAPDRPSQQPTNDR
jgi:hypothetical protein